MKTKHFLLTLLLTLFAVGTWAQDEATDEPVIIIWLNDGNSQKVLFSEMPVVTYDNGVLMLKGEETELSWSLENVNKFTIGNAATGIRDVKTADLDLLSDKLTVYDLNGRLVKKNVKSLSELPKGVYVIENGSVTTKVVRK
jgi:hypothetical protein